jgi:hypothetical protein
MFFTVENGYVQMEEPAALSIIQGASERRLIDFLRYVVWPAIEPETDFVDEPLTYAVCETIEAWLGLHPRGKEVEFDYLLWNCPPSTTKSIAISVAAACWEWGPRRRPHTRWFFCSYHEALWMRDARRRRDDVINSSIYQQLWGDVFSMDGEANQLHNYGNDKGGWMFSTSIGGAGTGAHPDRRVCDDPHNTTRGFESAADRRHAISWLDGVLGSRGVVRGAKQCVFGQQVHRHDASHHFGDKKLAGRRMYVWVVLPMHFRQDEERNVTPLGRVDWRTEPGELLCPRLLPQEKVEILEASIGPAQSPAQLEQNPRDPKSLIFQEDWAAFYEIRGPHFRILPLDTEQPIVIDTRELKWLVSIDTAGSEKDIKNESRGHDPSWSVAQLWAYHSRRTLMFLRAQWRARVAWDGLRDGVFNFLDRWEIGVQDSQNVHRRGKQVIIEVNNHNLGGALKIELHNRKSHGYDITPVIPTHSKIVRSTTLQTKMKNQQVFLLIEPVETDTDRRRDELYQEAWQSEVFTWTGTDGEQADQIDTSSMAAEFVGLLPNQQGWGGHTKPDQPPDPEIVNVRTRFPKTTKKYEW